MAAYQKEYKIKNADKEKARKKAHYTANRLTYIDRTKAWILANKTRRDAYQAEYRAKNKKQRNKKNIEYKRNNIQAKLASALRIRLNSALRGRLKSGSAVKDLGCSMDEFKLHLQSKFLPGMTWENYGRRKDEWSIDHIVALSTVDLTDRESFLRVAHYSNMRPLWNKDQVPTYHRFQKKGILWQTPNR